MSDLCQELKICTKCREERSISEFVADKQKKDGLRSSCKRCGQISNKKYYNDNKNYLLEQHKVYRETIKCSPVKNDKQKEYHKIHNKNYRELPKTKLRRSEISNIRKIENRPYKNTLKLSNPKLYSRIRCLYTKKYRLKNPDKITQYKIKRRTGELRSIKFLSPDDIFKMRLIYLKRDFISELTGIKHHVDHIHPLIHPDFCGLHVPWNLQILTESENCKKSNKLIY